MSKERELLKRSVEIIESLGPGHEAYNLIDEIGELLAQPEQEPVAWMDPENYKQVIARTDGALRYITRTPNDGDVPLYISPPKRKPIFNYTTPDYITGEYLEAYDLGFSDAEKAHGIGVGDE